MIASLTINENRALITLRLLIALSVILSLSALPPPQIYRSGLHTSVIVREQRPLGQRFTAASHSDIILTLGHCSGVKCTAISRYSPESASLSIWEG